MSTQAGLRRPVELTFSTESWMCRIAHAPEAGRVTPRILTQRALPRPDASLSPAAVQRRTFTTGRSALPVQGLPQVQPDRCLWTGRSAGHSQLSGRFSRGATPGNGRSVVLRIRQVPGDGRGKRG